MSPSIEAPTTTARRAGYQVSLTDLMLIVLGFGLSLGILARLSRSVPEMSWPIDYDALGGLLLALSAWLLFAVVAPIVRPAEGRRPLGLGSLLWRAVALAALLAFVAEEMRLLQESFGMSWWPGAPRSRRAPLSSFRVPRLALRSQLLPTSGLLVMIGLALGILPRRPGRGRPSGAGGWRLGPLAGAAVAGVVLLIPFGIEFVHLVLMALHAVHLAMMNPDLSSGTGMLLRIQRSGLPGCLGLAACLALASWIARDLRGGPPRASGRTILPRILSLIAASGLAVYLVIETVPQVDVWLAEGVLMAFGPIEGLILVAGLAGLAAGVVARALAPAPVAEPDETRHQRIPRSVGLLTRAILGLLALAAIGAAGLHVIPQWVEGAPRPEGPWGTIADVLPAAGRFATGYVMPQVVYLAPALAWLVVQVPRLVARRDPSEPSPLDAMFADRATMLRFLAYWPALTILGLAALPALFFTSLFLYQELHIFLGSWGHVPLTPT